jgi:TetR/AcrR family transcriptional regulator, transcriptional repressor for nem operon
MAQRRHADAPTAARILDVAERLVQVRGYNGFSYADIASELAITTTSVHYHFSSKGTLGEALIRRYASRFADALGRIDASTSDPPAQLDAYVAIYTDVLRANRMCLCGMLAAEYSTLPAPMRNTVTAFFDANERWLASVLQAGRDDHSLHFSGATCETARMLLSGLEGAMLIARSYDDVSRFESAASRLVNALNAD